MIREHTLKILISFLKNFIYLCMYICIFACVGSSLLHGLSLVSESGTYSLVAVSGLLVAVISLVEEHGLYSMGFSSCSLQALEGGLSTCGIWLSCSPQPTQECGIFPDQGLNQCPLALAGRF